MIRIAVVPQGLMLTESTGCNPAARVNPATVPAYIHATSDGKIMQYCHMIFRSGIQNSTHLRTICGVGGELKSRVVE